MRQRGAVILTVILVCMAIGVYLISNRDTDKKTNTLAEPLTETTSVSPSPSSIEIPDSSNEVEVEPSPSNLPTSSPSPSPSSSLAATPPSFLDSIQDDESIREELYRIYGRFNGLVGKYDNYKTTTKEQWDEYLGYAFLSEDVYNKFAEVTSNTALKEDFLNVASLIHLARAGLKDGTPSTADIQALKYAYEVINDVQAWSLPQVGDDLKNRPKFGASFALDEHKEATTISDWITSKS